LQWILLWPDFGPMPQFLLLQTRHQAIRSKSSMSLRRQCGSTQSCMNLQRNLPWFDQWKERMQGRLASSTWKKLCINSMSCRKERCPQMRRGKCHTPMTFSCLHCVIFVVHQLTTRKNNEVKSQSHLAKSTMATLANLLCDLKSLVYVPPQAMFPPNVDNMFGATKQHLWCDIMHVIMSSN